MFYECTDLESLDLSITDMQGMFEKCENLKCIIMNPVINQSTNTHNMFRNCPVKIIWDAK